MIYKMTLKDSVDTMTFNLLETPIVDKDIEGAVDNVTLDGNQYTDYLYLKKQYIQKWAIMCPDEYDELRGFYTRQFEDGEVPSYRVYYGANVTRDYTLNGDYFQFNAEGIETGMTLSQLLGNAEQTTYSGKNLLNDTTAQRTIPSSGNFNATIPMTIGAGTYSFGAFADGVFCPESNYYVFQFRNGSTVVVQSSTPSTPMTLTAQEASQVDNMFLYFNANFTGGYGGKHLTAMVCSGSTLGDYEPYTGSTSSQITPSPNPSYPQPIPTVTGEQTIKITGKNLLSITPDSVINQGAYVSGANTSTYIIKATGNDLFVNAASAAGASYAPTRGNLIDCNYGETICFNVGNDNFQKNYFTEWGEDLVSLGYTLVSSSSGTYTPTRQGCKYVSFRFGSGYSVTDTTYILSPIVCKTSNTSYEPYHGESYEINLGKNLLDINSLAVGGVTVSDGVATGQGQHFYASFGQNTDGVPFIKMNGQLAISFKAYTDGNVSTANTNGLVVRVVYTDGTSGLVIYCKNNETTAVQHTAITTFGKDVASIQLTYANDGGNIWHISEFQIEKGGQATSYAPYKTPIELAKIGNYQDRIYKNDGKWYIEKQVGKVVYDGSEAWSGANSNAYYYRTLSDAIILPSSATMPPVISDYYTPATRNDLWASRVDYGVGLYDGAIARVSIRNKDCANSDALKSWLSTHPTTVYYALATPTTTEITDETLLSQLNFLASLYEGENNISLVGTGAQGEMEVFIRDVMSVETDVVPEVPVRLTLTDDGVINACGCRRNVQLTMRETTE